MTTIPGIDVSYWKAGIDWPKVRTTGQVFVFVKASEGETYTDPTFDDNWNGAKGVGMLRGAFCFFHPNQDPVKQANLFISTVKSLNDNGELPPVLDLERADGQDDNTIITKAKSWLDAVEQAFGRKPIIYSGYFFLRDNFSLPGGGPPPWAKDYPLWIAQYPNQYNPSLSPLLPNGWFQWNFWQYSQTGSVNGINSPVDLDVFNGSLADLLNFAGMQAGPATTTPTSHTVQSSDSLQSIASKYGITLNDLVNANPQLVQPGATLSIPPSAVAPSSTPGTPAPPTPAPAGPRATYAVQPGDTLTAIAIKYGTTVAAIASANNISNPNLIQVGQVLNIP